MCSLLSTTAPGVELRADRIADAINVAQSQSNVAYNSVNGYVRTPPKDPCDHNPVTADVSFAYR